MSPLEVQDQGHTLSPVGSLKGQSLAPPSSHSTCSPLARSSVALESHLHLRWWHTTVHKNGHTPLCNFASTITTVHYHHLSGGDKGMDEAQLAAVKQLQNRSHTCCHPTPDPVILHNQHNIYRSFPSPCPSLTLVSYLTLTSPLRLTSNVSAKTPSITSEILPNSDPHSPFLTPRSSSTPLSPPGWITATHYSLEPLARASKGSSMCRTALLGSWWECASMNTSHPSSIHFTGFPSLPGLTTRSPSSLTSASMGTPPPISKNC